MPKRKPREPQHAETAVDRERAAVAQADRLTREVVTATLLLPESTPPSLGRTLRECAALVHAGIAAACREPSPCRALRGLEAADHKLRRLAVWIDLAERFGDLSLEVALGLLDLQSTLSATLAALARAWRRDTAPGPASGPGAGPAADPSAHATLELTVPGPARA